MSGSTRLSDGVACGIDVGGTKIAGGVVDVDGRILEELKVTSPADDGEAIEDAIGDLVTELAGRHPIERVGVGVAGYIDKDRARVMFAPNLALRDVDLKADLERRVDLPVVVENDANAAAWGEFTYGAAEDVDDLLLITVGTGVGGGVVLDGRLHRGAFGVGGEAGHVRMVPGGVRCGCGNLGCLESYASGTALVREARVGVQSAAPGSDGLLERAGGDVEAVTGPLITDAARDGDVFALAQIDRIGTWLGEGVASIAAILDPGVIVIGGGVSEAGEMLLEPVRRAFSGHVLGLGHRPIGEVRLAELGNRAGLIGAADLARRP